MGLLSGVGRPGGRRKKIAVVTGSRAEYGLLEPLCRAIEADRRLRLQLIVTGTHLTTKSWRDIDYEIAARVRMQDGKQVGRAADVAAVGRGVAGLGEAFTKLKSDVVVVLGDRIEAMAAACAAQVGGFHLAHIHGGDRAQGVADEAMRHAISKLAHVHFAATAQSARRLVRMGELRERVFNVGSPAVDGLEGIEPADDVEQPFVMLMHHPVGASDALEKKWMMQLLQATSSKAFGRLVFAPNSDAGSGGIRAALRGAKVAAIEHVPRERFVGLLKRAAVLVGNSSAGLIEAAAVGVPVVNVGPRQAGRQRASHVIDCEHTPGRALGAAVGRAMAVGRRRVNHPYGDGNSAGRMAVLLATLPWGRMTVCKRNGY